MCKHCFVLSFLGLAASSRARPSTAGSFRLGHTACRLEQRRALPKIFVNEEPGHASVLCQALRGQRRLAIVPNDLARTLEKPLFPDCLRQVSLLHSPISFFAS